MSGSYNWPELLPDARLPHSHKVLSRNSLPNSISMQPDMRLTDTYLFIAFLWVPFFSGYWLEEVRFLSAIVPYKVCLREGAYLL